MLKTYSQGTSSAHPPLLIVHGLFGSARNWGVIAKRLSDDRVTYTVDMRNHGESPRYPTQSYEDMAQDLAEVIKGIKGPVDVLGHSMGGKSAMVLALQSPELVNRLLVADIAPVRYTHTQMPLIHAMRDLDLSTIEKRSDADRALQQSIPEEGVRAFLLQSLDVKAKEWRLNLDVLGDEMDKIIGFPEVSGQFDKPTLFLSGGASEYVLPEHRAGIKSLFTDAYFAKMPNVGHWLHAEKPREFEASIRAFFN
ncbi:alpha/beta fold hydrolase [Falsihalocynthiibacter sp. SS001]|uniref:alpha/beta fold hydrolase n=1 Tax=Falsihalocynthiibacter sp. SS001 TaxID=3349698 RepID=UPI0036D2439D